MAIFMKYEGIEGESQVRGRTGFMEVEAVGWGLSRAMSAVKTGGRGDAEVQVQDVTVSRRQDSLSALLLNEAAFGAMDKKVEFEFVRTGPNNKPVTFLRIILESAGISSYSLGGAGADARPMESLSINFLKMSMASFAVTDELTAVPNTATIDVTTGTP